MKLSPDEIPPSALAAALDVYKWRDEAGKTIDTYGYGTTGNAGKLSQVICADNSILTTSCMCMAVLALLGTGN